MYVATASLAYKRKHTWRQTAPSATSKQSIEVPTKHTKHKTRKIYDLKGKRCSRVRYIRVEPSVTGGLIYFLWGPCVQEHLDWGLKRSSSAIDLSTFCLSTVRWPHTTVGEIRLTQRFCCRSFSPVDWKRHPSVWEYGWQFDVTLPPADSKWCKTAGGVWGKRVTKCTSKSPNLKCIPTPIPNPNSFCEDGNCWC